MGKCCLGWACGFMVIQESSTFRDLVYNRSRRRSCRLLGCWSQEIISGLREQVARWLLTILILSLFIIDFNLDNICSKPTRLHHYWSCLELGSKYLGSLLGRLLSLGWVRTFSPYIKIWSKRGTEQEAFHRGSAEVTSFLPRRELTYKENSLICWRVGSGAASVGVWED